MKTRIRRVLALTVCAAALATLAPTPAPAAGPLYRTTPYSRITHKFLRGLINIPFCVTEIPIEINREWRSYDPVGGTLKGLVQGFYFTGERLVLAVVDVVTFPIDVWGNNYGTKMRSEFPFIDETAE